MNQAKLLLKKYLTGDCTRKEKEQLYHYLMQSEAEDYDEVLQSLWAELHEAPRPGEASSERIYQFVVENTSSSQRYFFPRQTWWVAASLTGALILLAAWYYVLPQQEMHRTQYGEVKTLVLPDSSVVHLNANSQLSYSSDLATNDVREVWLKGEAYFQVTHQQISTDEPVKLIVHTNQVNIEVLGTSFNVKDRRGVTQVVLDEGKVRLSTPESNDELVNLEPGEAVQVNGQQKFSVQSVEEPTQVSSWKENELYFDDHSLEEIQQILADNYGLQLRFAEPSLRQLRFTGSTPADNLSVLFTTLEKSFALEIKELNGTYMVRSLP
ncbi:MAG: FecR domain-containing protein [Bacteroidota bacterium]